MWRVALVRALVCLFAFICVCVCGGANSECVCCVGDSIGCYGHTAVYGCGVRRAGAVRLSAMDRMIDVSLCATARARGGRGVVRWYLRR